MSFDAESQRRRFEQADHQRSDWILRTRSVLLHERGVFRSLEIGAGPVLELGAGEGLTLRFRPRLASLGYVGSDLHPARAKAVRDSARQAGLDASSLACDATQLPFRRHSFGTVLCRDMLHHLAPESRQRALSEMARVLTADGQLSVIEPNAGRSPLVALFSALMPTERMALGFHASSLRELLTPYFDEVKIDHLEPSMLYRLVYHYRFGQPALSRSKRLQRVMQGWERLSERWIPPVHWTYLRALCRGPRPPRR